MVGTAKSSKTKTKKTTKTARTTGAAKTVEKKEKMTFGKVICAILMIAAPLIGGSIISFFTISAQELFSKFEQPPLAPPAWLFPVAWTILYILMGIASYLMYRAKARNKVEKRLKVAEMVVFYVQLVFNFVWTLIFFNLDAKYFAFGWLVVMWLMIIALVAMAFKNSKPAAWMLVPYLLWCTFAAYLNLSIAILN